MFIIYQVHLSSNKGYHEALKKKSMAPILYDDTCLHVKRWRFWRQFNDPDNGLAMNAWMMMMMDMIGWSGGLLPPQEGLDRVWSMAGGPSSVKNYPCLPFLPPSLQTPKDLPRFHGDAIPGSICHQKNISCLDTSSSITTIITAGQSKTIISSHFFLPQRYLQQNRSL